ncbi:hypothetical protein AUC61_05165 [Pseudomonas sp. S25]|uniref:ATPase n=1 Tax=Pseudomonas maioricensis TaxID=1766623 RepID=A0ABS9ZFT7_9PSED|nr:hypothetical protein [Pseudomonas sp. S25]MCI8208921.1 hypothetical protein [Pseudomonas sp. S25]
MSEEKMFAAENWPSKECPIVVVPHESAQCYFRPETEEFVFISACEAASFENHWRDMSTSMDDFHKAKDYYDHVLAKYADTAISDALAAVSQLQDVDAAEIELAKRRKEMQEKLADLSHKGLGYKDVVELIPVAGKGVSEPGGGKATGLVYVNKGYFSKTQDGLKLHSVSLNGKDKKDATQSIYSKDQNGKTRIDTNKLKKQLTTLKTAKIKLELKDVLKWAGAEKALDDLKEDYVLYDWAKSWNDSLHGQKEFGANVDISGAAQFMRFTSNAGAKAEFDVEKKQLSIMGEYKRTLTVASGFGNLSFFIPDRTGWGLKMEMEDGRKADLGLVRLCIDAQVSGFLGSSLQLEAQLQVVQLGDQQIVAGQPGGNLPRFRERKNDKTFYQKMDKEDEGLQVSAEYFRGGRAEFALKGSLQWMKPTPPPGDPAAPTGILKSSGKFTDFCSVGGSIAGLAGIGIGGKFHCTFINGKFCFHVAASLCCGKGAKGGLMAEVDAANIVEFGAWLIYQLYKLDYGFFNVVEDKAYIAYSQYCVMQIEKIEESIYKGYDGVVKTTREIAGKFNEYLNALEEENRKGLIISEHRNRLAKNIIEKKRDLLLHTPEAKGILLYLLTRHGIMDHLDADNITLLGDIYADRKEAIICVLTSVQTISEWSKVMCRITVDGSSLRGENSEAEVAKIQAQHLVRFLQEGHNRSKDLINIFNRLKKKITLGYALDMNDTAFYQLNSESNPNFPRRCDFGPCKPEIGQLA